MYSCIDIYVIVYIFGKLKSVVKCILTFPITYYNASVDTYKGLGRRKQDFWQLTLRKAVIITLLL